MTLKLQRGGAFLFGLAGFAFGDARVDAGLVGGDGHHRSLDAVGPSGFSGSRMRLRSSGSSRGGRAPRRKRFFRREWDRLRERAKRRGTFVKAPLGSTSSSFETDAARAPQD